MALVLNQQGDLEPAGRCGRRQRLRSASWTIKEPSQSCWSILVECSRTRETSPPPNDDMRMPWACRGRSTTVAAPSWPSMRSGRSIDSQGEFAPSVKLLRNASDIDVAAGHGSPSSETLIDLGDVLQHRGDLLERGADLLSAGLDRLPGRRREKLERLCALRPGKARLARDRFRRSAAELRPGNATSERARRDLHHCRDRDGPGRVAIEEGHGAETEVPLRRVGKTFDEAGKQDDSIAATTLLARALVSQGKAADASRELETVPSPENIQNLGMRLSALIAKGRVQLAMGKSIGRSRCSSIGVAASRTRRLYRVCFRRAPGATQSAIAPLSEATDCGGFSRMRSRPASSWFSRRRRRYSYPSIASGHQ